MAEPFHTPVLVRELCEAIVPALTGATGPGGPVLVDATCGAGGHVLAVLREVTPASILLFDRDPEALAYAAERLRDAPCRVDFVHAPFSHLRHELVTRGVSSVAAIVADLGVSSHQLDTPGRGFSFRDDGPLDMRMDPTGGETAADVLASIDAPALARILREYGEEPQARKIAAAIVAARPTTTAALAAAVKAAVGPARPVAGRPTHPATRTFQALRIHVNDELGQLDALLETAPELLAVGGRLAIITFHSLEDRRVKRAMAGLSRPHEPPPGVPVRADDLPRPRFRIPTRFRGGITAAPDELDRNPRARSARLRVVERCLQ